MENAPAIWQTQWWMEGGNHLGKKETHLRKEEASTRKRRATFSSV